MDTTVSLTPRQQLAVTCRTLAAQGYDDKLAGHVSVRDREDGTLIVPRVGVFWDEITADDFVRIDSDGRISRRVVAGDATAAQVRSTIAHHVEGRKHLLYDDERLPRQTLPRR